MKISIVGGGGRAGLPLALSLAEAGHKIIIVDKDEDKVSKINMRIMPFHEKDADEALRKYSLEELSAVVGNEKILGSDICILIIGTPVNSDGSPSTNTLLSVVSELTTYLHSTKLLMLRSTVYPGITQEISSVLSNHGLKTLVSFCPERIAEGVALDEIKVLPQIIGASEEQAYLLSEEVFKKVTPKLIRTSVKEAEIGKLFTNTYRYFKFAIANEFFKICVDQDIDWQKVWYSIKEDYPRAKDLPLPGFAAGPCLVKDTMQLDYFTKNTFDLGKISIKTNEEMPDYIINLLKNRYDLKNMTVGILGMTFKAGIDDFRSSLSFRLETGLLKVSKKVLCSDEMLQKDGFVSSEELISASDLVIIATPHSSYARLKINTPLVDIWRVNPSESII
jgi:UDP-N-acetyl-D-mannosaminuronic acid dehydrogenase